MRMSITAPDSPDRHQMRSESLESGADEDGGIPYSRLKIKRSIDCAPSSSLSPAGIAGLLKVVMCMHGMNTSRSVMSMHIMNADSSQKEAGASKPKSAASGTGEITRNLDQRYCILLDGIFTFLPPSVSTITGAGAAAVAAPKVKDISDAVTKTRAVGSMENRSIPLSGYVIRKTDDKKILITGSKGEMTSYSLEASSVEDCHRWLAVLNAHVEHVDNKAGSKWIF